MVTPPVTAHEAENIGEPMLTLTYDEQVGVFKWLSMAITELSGQIAARTEELRKTQSITSKTNKERARILKTEIVSANLIREYLSKVDDMVAQTLEKSLNETTIQ